MKVFYRSWLPILVLIMLFFCIMILFFCQSIMNPVGEYWDDPSDIVPENETVRMI